ncbi:MAG: sensor domain-containing diguanylate cyclase [Sporichthyaceae bacterium]
MARALGFSRDLFDVLDRAVSEGCRVVDADSASVSVLDRPAGLVRVLVNVGDLSASEEPRPRNETYQLAGFPKLSQVVGDLQPWTCARTDQHPDPQELALLVELGKGASLGAPVVVDGDLWGELYFTRHLGRVPFDDTDLAYVETLAAILAAGVSRAVRESSLTELAYQDPLTGLANRRRLDQVAASMISARTGLVVVSVDVNDLKPVNDRDGHAAGDRLLRDVARALTWVSEELPGSLAARTGGDEFCLVAPTADVERVADAIRRFMTVVQELPHPAGVSCGIAWTGSGSTSPGTLFAEADRAMYHAKKHALTEPYGVILPTGG